MEKEYRSFDGELRTLAKTNEHIKEVEVCLLNDCPNRNGWQYTDMHGNKDQFCGTPILIAYTNGGKQIGDGHNFDYVRDEKTGDLVPTFLSATAERIIGAMSDNPEDIRVEERDGKNWIIGKGSLWSWYSREAVNKIEECTNNGKPMEISIETLVNKWHYDESGVEVEDEYTVLGTTILGDGVMPAVAEARIMTLSEIESEFNELKLRAASYIENGECENKCDGECDCECDNKCGDNECGDECDCKCDGGCGVEENKECEEDDVIDQSDEVPDETENKPQQTTNVKGVKNMTLSKKQLAELAPKFEGYKVLAGEQVEDGIRVCLMSASGDTATYMLDSMEEVVIPSKIMRQNTHVCFAFGDETITVEFDNISDEFSANIIHANSELERINNELAIAKETISAMQEAENARRLNAAKAKAVATLSAFNANRADKVEESILDAINSDIESGMYTNSVDGNGTWVGEEAVANRVLASCATCVMEMDRVNALKNNSVHVYDKLVGKKTFDDGSVGALLSAYDIN